MDRKRILVVEDTRMIANVIYDLLSPSYDVTLSFDGKAGASLALEQDFDLIVTDFMMPGMNGGELATMVRKNEDKRQIPIIALTSQSQEHVGPEYESTFDHFLVKPFGLEDLPDIVSKFLGTE